MFDLPYYDDKISKYKNTLLLLQKLSLNKLETDESDEHICTIINY